jgi:hypothetical protein
VAAQPQGAVVARFIQDPVTHKLIPAEEYRPAAKQVHGIMPDIEPFVSPIDRSVIRTRPQLADHHRQHGTTNSRDYSKEYIANRGKQKLAEQAREAKADRIAKLNRLLGG